jgi:hypothetical protein
VTRTLYVCDLDGTLLLPDGTLGARTIEVVNALIAEGGLFSIATARSFHSASRVVSELRLEHPMITYGGATLVDPITGVRHKTIAMPESSVRALLATFADRGLQPVLYAIHEGIDRFCWLDRDTSPAVTEFVGLPPRSPRAMPVQDWEEVDLATVFYITLLGTEGELTAIDPAPGCRALLGGDIYNPDQFFLEFMAEQASKGHGVVDLKREIGADRVIVFGDSLSDLSMFAVACEAYATADAVEEVRAAATAVIGSNTDEGVAAWLANRLAGL